MSYYGYILLFSFLGPLCVSFDKKVAYYKSIPRLIAPLLIVSGLFLVWDQWFTVKGVWGFNPEYVAGIYLGKLPLEEALFFAVVPYNCIFIYEVVGAYFTPRNNAFLNQFFFLIFGLLGAILLIKTPMGWYPYTAVTLSLILAFSLVILSPKWLSQFVLTYLICLIPFLVVNGLLTGAATENPVVWYNEQEFSSWRIITIPVEDLFYNFDLLVGFVLLFEFQRERLAPRKQ
ncbi:MAG: lycopene cyclase domain-containing protein [Bacteroidota bacterium]